VRLHLLVVAAALYDREGRVLIAERPVGKHLAGRWEFPGGKVNVGESEPQCLDGQRLKWVQPARLLDEDILEADRAFAEALARLGPKDARGT
jgi:8-oxo-dGTP diphosphatase